MSQVDDDGFVLWKSNAIVDYLAAQYGKDGFYPTNARQQASARMNRTRPRDVLVFDTLSLARAHGPYMEVCPINSGSTIRRPARRGLGTFTAIGEMSYRDWTQKRGGRDRILEVTLKGGAEDIASHLVERRQLVPTA